MRCGYIAEEAVLRVPLILRTPRDDKDREGSTAQYQEYLFVTKRDAHDNCCNACVAVSS